MVGLKFGSVKSSVHNMDNVYEKEEKKSTRVGNNFFHTQEYFNNGKNVAKTSYATTISKTYFSIYDKNTNRNYSTGWQDKKNASDKFTEINFSHADGGYYSIIDSNRDGVVDENDTVTFTGRKGESASIKLGDLLA